MADRKSGAVPLKRDWPQLKAVRRDREGRPCAVLRRKASVDLDELDAHNSRFVTDSPLEGDGFERSVPVQRAPGQSISGSRICAPRL